MMGPELHTLTLCAREVLSEETVARVHTELCACRNYALFRGACFYTKMYPMVGKNLLETGAHTTSEFAARAVEETSAVFRRYWTVRMPGIAALLKSVRRVFHEGAVPFIFLKGFPFASRYYLEPEFRVSADVDMMVREEDSARALRLLERIGARPLYAAEIHRAKMSYFHKAELTVPRLRTQLDVSWSEMGNANIGQVARDNAELWNRAEHVAGSEWQLSREDTFLFHVRHFGHGHDFDHALLQACADVTALLRKDRSSFDWDYVCSVAGRHEFIRVLRFFSDFYDQHYRDATMLELTPALGLHKACASDAECIAFTERLLVPLLGRSARETAWQRLVNGNRSVAAKFWALDRSNRLLRLLRVIAWPSREEIVQLTEDLEQASIVYRRVWFYLSSAIPGAPGLVAGIVMRAKFRLVRKGAHTGATAVPGDVKSL
jgi:hypothetical protein